MKQLAVWLIVVGGLLVFAAVWAGAQSDLPPRGLPSPTPWPPRHAPVTTTTTVPQTTTTLP